MSIIDKAAKKRDGSGRPSLVERAMSRNGAGAPEAGEAALGQAKPAARPMAGTAPAGASGAARVNGSAADSAKAGTNGAGPADASPEPAASGRLAGSRRAAPAAPRASRPFRLDWDELERRRLIGTSRHAKRLQSEIRTIKSRLMSGVGFFKLKRGARQRAGENLVLVTSARQGEGKSFTAVNLALSLALEDRIQVLLVDADAARGSVTDFFGIDRGEKGLLDRLADPGMDLSEALWRAEGSCLSVLPVGNGASTSADLYASPAMTRLLEELSNRYPDRLIIFDAPPMLAANDPMVLSHQIRQVLMVVEAGKTTEATIRTALDVLGQRERVSLVLNHCTIEGDEVQSTSYGYGYGYGPGMEQRDSPPSGRQEAA